MRFLLVWAVLDRWFCVQTERLSYQDLFSNLAGAETEHYRHKPPQNHLLSQGLCVMIRSGRSSRTVNMRAPQFSAFPNSRPTGICPLQKCAEFRTEAKIIGNIPISQPQLLRVCVPAAQLTVFLRLSAAGSVFPRFSARGPPSRRPGHAAQGPLGRRSASPARKH